MKINATTFVNQVVYMRREIDPDMTGLAMAIFVYVASRNHAEGVPTSQIRGHFEISASTCSRNVHLLSEGQIRNGDPRMGFGLLTSQNSSNDRRSHNLYLTPKGIAIAKRLAQIV